MVRTTRSAVAPPVSDADLPDVSGLDGARRSGPDYAMPARRGRSPGSGPPAKEKILKRQITTFVPMDDWLLLRAHSARVRLPVSQILLDGLRPLLVELRRAGAEATGGG